MMLAQERGALPRRRRPGRDGALLLQDGDRADRLDLDHRRRHLGLHRADPGEHLHPQDAVRLLVDPQPASRAAADRQIEEQRRRSGRRSSSAAARSSISISSPPEEKDVFKTSFEIDQRWLLELAADRTPYIDQAQSLNLFIPADVDKWDLLMLHLPRLGARHQKPLLSALQVGAARRLRRRRRGRQHARPPADRAADRPIMTSAWRASDGDRRRPLKTGE